MNERALQRHLKKAQLLQRIEQQRDRLADERQNWLNSTRMLDSGWQIARSHPIAVSASISLLVVYALRNPRKLWRKGQWALLVCRGVRYVNQALRAS